MPLSMHFPLQELHGLAWWLLATCGYINLTESLTFSSSVTLATIEVLISHMWLVYALLNGANIEHFHHHRHRSMG